MGNKIIKEKMLILFNGSLSMEKFCDGYYR
jgi:hypothetical protein